MSDQKPLFTTTVTRDGVDQPFYRGHSVIELLQEGYGLMDVMFLLLLNKFPTPQERQVAEHLLVLVADNGPSVSGAMNSIVSARAGIPAPQALASGLITIGPRFGGASTPCAELIKQAVQGEVPASGFINFVQEQIGTKRAPGFGHRVKSVDDPDARVAHLFSLAEELGLPKTHINYAQEVQGILTAKKPNLIVNIDGALGVTLLDLGFPSEVCDCFFTWGRSLGFLAHILDQQLRKEKMVRLPGPLVDFQGLEEKPVPPKE